MLQYILYIHFIPKTEVMKLFLEDCSVSQFLFQCLVSPIYYLTFKQPQCNGKKILEQN